jgi:hypothetical protein
MKQYKVHLSGLSLLAREFILWREIGQMKDIKYSLPAIKLPIFFFFFLCVLGVLAVR